MSQASKVINGNQAGSAFTTDLNAALAALLSLNSGASAPTVDGPAAYQLWSDTTAGRLKQYTAGGTWVSHGPLAGLHGNGLATNLTVIVDTGDLTLMTITADVLTVEGTYLASVSTTCDTNTSAGAGGIDTGSWATNSWYQLFVITNDDGSSVTTLAVLAGGTPVMPTGYTRKRRVGWVRTTGTATNLRPFRQEGPRVLYDADEQLALNTGTSTSFADVDVSAYAPPGVRSALVHVLVLTTTGQVTVNVRPKGSTASTGTRVLHVGNTTSDSAGGGNVAPVILDANRVWQYKMTQVSGSGGTVYAWVLGWFDNALS